MRSIVDYICPLILSTFWYMLIVSAIFLQKFAETIKMDSRKFCEVYTDAMIITPFIDTIIQLLIDSKNQAKNAQEKSMVLNGLITALTCM